MNVVNPTNDEPGRIDLYGTVGVDPWSGDEQSITAKGVKKAIEQIDGDSVDVHINSYGGIAFEGIGIYNVLKESDKTVNVYIDAIAASAASLIAMAGDTIFMPKNAQLMVHHASTLEYGNANDFEKVIQSLNAMDKSMILTYESRFKGTEAELRELLDAETFLTSDEALAFGFVDKIVDYDSDEDDSDESNADIKNRLFSKYSKEPIAAEAKEDTSTSEDSSKEAVIDLDIKEPQESFAEKLINLI
ncbi:Clp protease [Companilactobacillus nodensis DSM 19682 = JCM 14932 = NBRC 107160]|uniref:ATP-dependent Clp protease proteolytic subunit n=2 Tax=Companilactobacillus nodensis TaxID=460870 RepID=A0A0R1KHG9_9LACO|nr:Clp protease [Companilactobacillus nodensis DSM 19682 = JCM 14932 = NBRC 107160]